MPPKKIPAGSNLPVRLTLQERDLIRDHTLYDPDFADQAQEDSAGIRLNLSPDDIDEILGYIAAAVDCADDEKVEKRLTSLYKKIQKVLDSYG